MHITEKTKEYECCCSCKHNIRKKDGENTYCECEIDGHYIGYIASSDNVCERWKRDNMDYETLRNSMTVQDAARVLMETNCYGTMDIAKNVILKALDEQMSSSEKPNKWIPLTKRPMTEEERELTISYLEDMKEEYVEGEGNERYPLPEWYMLDKVIKIISQQPKTGQWEWVQYDANPNIGNWHCSECRYILCGEIKENPIRLPKYCPECGARMSEVSK